jgi:hypothetical protein
LFERKCGADFSWYWTFLVPNCLFQRVPKCLGAELSCFLRYWIGHLGTRYWTFRDLDETIRYWPQLFGTYLICQYFCTSSSLIYHKSGWICVFNSSSVDWSRRSVFLYWFLFSLFWPLLQIPVSREFLMINWLLFLFTVTVLLSVYSLICIPY